MSYPAPATPTSQRGRLATWLAFASIVLPLVGLAFFTFFNTRATVLNRVRESQTAVARLAAASLRQTLQDRLDTAITFTQLPSFHKAMLSNDRQELLPRLRVMVERDNLVGVAVVTDPKGTIIAAWPPSPGLEGHNFSDQDWYRGVSAHWQPYVSDLFQRRTEKKQQSIALAVPLVERGRTRSILACALDLTYMQALVRSTAKGTNQELVLLDPRGRAAAHPNLEGAGAPFEGYGLIKEFAQAQAGQEAAFAFTDPLTGRQELGVLEPVDVAGRHWVVLAKRPAGESEKPVFDLLWRILAAGLVLTAGAGWAAYLLLRSRRRSDRLSNRLEAQNLQLRIAAKELELTNEELGSLQTDLERQVTQRSEELRLKELEFQEAQKMETIGRLAGGVAHDFNNLLSVVLGHTGLLAEELKGDERAAEHLQGIHKAAERGARLTAQLLAFARRQKVEPRSLDLGALAEGLQPMLQRLLGVDVQVELRKQLPLPAVLADPGQMEQVLINLCINSRDAMPSGGRLLIETYPADLDGGLFAGTDAALPGRYAVLAVTDTGSGMTPEVLKRLFEPFFTTKPLGKGTGLGLAMVQGAVRQAGGRIFVESVPGQGSVFKVYLPAYAGDARSTGAALASAAPSRGGSESLLLVEDDPALRAPLRSVLKAKGYQVLAASNASDALRLIKAHTGAIDLLISDIIMPGMSGVELAQRLRQEQPGLKVLLMSGYTEAAMPPSEGGTSFLAKPFTPAELTARVREILDRR